MPAGLDETTDEEMLEEDPNEMLDEALDEMLGVGDTEELDMVLIEEDTWLEIDALKVAEEEIADGTTHPAAALSGDMIRILKSSWKVALPAWPSKKSAHIPI